MSLRHVAGVAGLACVSAMGMTAVGLDARAATPPSTDPAAAETAPPDSEQTRILLTNDDGWSGGGLLTLYEALVGAGFDVVVFAPNTDMTGSGASSTYERSLQISAAISDVFAVDGSPADAVEAGISLAFGGVPPDLVISGPNPGFTIGDAVVQSGTVGAAVTALNDGIPAIAVSAGPNPETNQPDFTTATTVVIDLVNALVSNAADDDLLLPRGLGLNVNVPFSGDTPPAGVAITSTDNSYVDLGFALVELPVTGESILAEAQIVENPTIDPASDSAAVTAGLVAITFIEGNYDATDPDDRAATIAELTPVLTGIVGTEG